jgi:hypothetical protein
MVFGAQSWRGGAIARLRGRSLPPTTGASGQPGAARKDSGGAAPCEIGVVEFALSRPANSATARRCWLCCGAAAAFSPRESWESRAAMTELERLIGELAVLILLAGGTRDMAGRAGALRCCGAGPVSASDGAPSRLPAVTRGRAGDPWGPPQGAASARRFFEAEGTHTRPGGLQGLPPSLTSMGGSRWGV